MAVDGAGGAAVVGESGRTATTGATTGPRTVHRSGAGLDELAGECLVDIPTVTAVEALCGWATDVPVTGRATAFDGSAGVCGRPTVSNPTAAAATVIKLAPRLPGPSHASVCVALRRLADAGTGVTRPFPSMGGNTIRPPEAWPYRLPPTAPSTWMYIEPLHSSTKGGLHRCACTSCSVRHERTVVPLSVSSVIATSIPPLCCCRHARPVPSSASTASADHSSRRPNFVRRSTIVSRSRVRFNGSVAKERNQRAGYLARTHRVGVPACN